MQRKVDKDPHNSELKKEEAEILREYNCAVQDEEKFLFQQAKIEWLTDGDKNSKFFHAVVKGRTHKNRIEMVCDEKGDRYDGCGAPEQFVKHFQSFLGTQIPVQILIPILSTAQIELLMKMLDT